MQAIVGASDRMLTVGDVEFERPVPKLYKLSTSIVAMIAGDAGAQDEICNRTIEKIGTDLPSVRDAVTVYCAEVAGYHKRNGEREVLASLGLNMKSFIRRQQELGSEFSDRILFDLKEAKDNVGIETIIAGVDNVGAHIYTIGNEGSALCQDSVGFAAIGYGARHAESQFILQAYSSQLDLANASLLAFTAKRRAEVAPGVGKYTDVYAISPTGLISNPINPTVIKIIEAAYEQMEKDQNEAIIRAHQAVRDAIIAAVHREDEHAKDANQSSATEHAGEQGPI